MHLLRRLASFLALAAAALPLHPQSATSSTQKTAPPLEMVSVANLTGDPHSTPGWALIAPHLPNLVLAPPDQLEMAGDVLRARGFLSDAQIYYRAAADRGGELNRLLKKQGTLHLEQHQAQLARLCFQQARQLNKLDAEAWNNLGASDFMLGNLSSAVGEYKRAVRLNRESAIFHANLSLAYFETKNTHGARKELAKALALDPDIMQHRNHGGYNLQVLSGTHYAEICLEMARTYAAQGNRAATLEWLAKALTSGMDIHTALRTDPNLSLYAKDEALEALLNQAAQPHTQPTRTTPKLPPPNTK